VLFRSYLTDVGCSQLLEAVRGEAKTARLTGSLPSSTCSLKLQLDVGKPCPVDLLIGLTREAYSKAKKVFPAEAPLQDKATESTVYTSIGLLYGPAAFMSEHTDSPTFVGKSHEWLVCFSIGNTIVYQLDGVEVNVQSGDCLVMNSMAVLHGVKGVLAHSSPEQCPLQDARLGLLLWELQDTSDLVLGNSSSEDLDLDCMGALFGD
jgi:hypothetical protein